MEHKALLLCSRDMVDHLVAHGCKSIADTLVSEELITFEEYSKIQLDNIDQDRARTIIGALQIKVKTEPSRFDIFIAVLKKNGLDTLASKLQKKLSKFCLVIAIANKDLLKLRYIEFLRNTGQWEISKSKSCSRS